MSTTAGTDLGVCGVPIDADHRCSGRLIVDQEVGALVEVVCTVCGTVAARPVRKIGGRAGEPDPDESLW